MAAEKAQLIQAKNDVVQVAHPFTADTNTSYLTAAIAAAGTAATVKDNVGFAQNDYAILGNLGSKQTEIVKINAAVTAGAALTFTATTFAHPVGTKITLIRYNQVAIYGSTTATDSAPTAIGSAQALDVSNPFTEIKASTTYTYYYARLYNSQTTTYSSYSSSILGTGLTQYARGELKKEFLSIFNEKLDDLISDEWLNRAANRWQREIQERRPNWSVLRASSRLTSIQDQQAYALPSDIQSNDTNESIVSIKLGVGTELTYADQEVFLGLTSTYIGTTLAAAALTSDTSLTLTDSSDFAASGSVYIQGDTIAYTANNETTNVLSGVTGIIAAGHANGEEVWQTYTAGQPVYYSVDDGNIKLYPIPNSSYAAYNIYVEYWKKFPVLDDDADETLFLKPTNCYLYLHWQSAIRRNLTEAIQLVRESKWREDLERKVFDDPDFRDIRIQPRNIYQMPY